MMGVFLLCSSPSASVAGESPAAERVVASYFASKPNYIPGDLIQQSDFRAIAKLLAEQDRELPEPAQIEARIPSDSSFISRELRSRKGQAFMRRLVNIPGGYHQFQQLIDSNQGEKTARRVMSQAGGHKLIRYLSQTQQGAALGRQIPGSARRSGRGGRNQPAPPPAIYTANELSAAIQLQLKTAPPAR